jgi:hypothetical protein
MDTNIPTRVTETVQQQKEAQIPFKPIDTHILTEITNAGSEPAQERNITNTFNAVVEDRMRRMRELKEKMQSSTGFEQIATEPAYIRNGEELNIDINHSTTSVSYATKTTQDGRITENGFFNNNID